MKNIYVGHSKDFDYNKLLVSLSKSKISKYFNIVFPHVKSDKPFNSKEFLKTCKYMIAEVSSPSIGIGIELGWANLYGISIICIYRKGSKVSGSLKVITNNIIEYDNEKHLIDKLETLLYCKDDSI